MSSNLVCPRCGTPAAPQRDCAKCGLSLDRQQLPTREAWEREVLAAAREFAGETESPREQPRSSSRIWLLLAVIPIGAIAAAAALLVTSSDSPPESREQRPSAAGSVGERRSAGDGSLDICTKRWNSDRRILRGGYARGAETALVIRDADGRCVIALPARAAGRPGFATFVVVEGGNWASYANNPPVSDGPNATGEALARAKEWERGAAEMPNATVRQNGSIEISDG